MSKLRVLVLAGGWSGEKEVSLNSGRTVAGGFDSDKYEVSLLDPAQDLEELSRRKGRTDMVFNLLHGKYGEDGCMQGMLEVLGLPYVGSGVLSSALSFNKKLSKERYRNSGLDVAKEIVLRRRDDLEVEEFIRVLGSVVVVKPVSEGSSLGVSVCKGEDDIIRGIEKAFEFGREVLLEEYLVGKEVTCCVLGSNESLETLPPVEIVPREEFEFFNYKAKYTTGATDEICPARLESEVAERVRECGKVAHGALGCSVWSRTDMIVQDGRIVVLETNTIPGMSENSLFPLAARKSGMTVADLVDKMIACALEEEGGGQQTVPKKGGI